MVRRAGTGRRPWSPVGLLLAGALACAHRAPQQDAPLVTAPDLRPAPVSRAVLEERAALARGQAIAEAAQSFVGAASLVVEGRTYRYDCSGLVEAVFARAGLESKNRTVMMLYREAADAGLLHKRLLPIVGDLALFDATVDKDRDGASGDLFTHVAIVVGVEPERGSITLVHKGSRGVGPIVMNLRYPSVGRTPDGVRLNDVLTAPGLNNPENRLTGELWYAFASFWARPP